MSDIACPKDGGPTVTVSLGELRGRAEAQVEGTGLRDFQLCLECGWNNFVPRRGRRP